MRSRSAQPSDIRKGIRALETPTFFEDSMSVVLEPPLEAASAAETPATPPPTTATLVIRRRGQGPFGEKASSWDDFLPRRGDDAEASAMSSILGYAFWHRPRPGVSLRAYERRLLAFQSSLKRHPPDGLIDALSFREEASPWSRRRSTTYEDWYLVRDFQSLGTLNDAAVADPNRRPHDEVARDASDGAGGVYRLLGGDLRLQDALLATWIRKPPRTPYQT